MLDEVYGVESEDATAEISVLDDDSNVRVLNDQCTTCLFRPGNLMHLEPGRLREMILAAIAEDSCIPCHSTLPYGQYRWAKAAVCRGFFDRYLHALVRLKIAYRMDWVSYVPRPEDEAEIPRERHDHAHNSH